MVSTVSAPSGGIEAPAVTPSRIDNDARRDRGRWLLVAVLALVIGLFLLHSSPWVGARFGESHDGRNAATWAASSRAIREDGPITSRFGGRYDDQRYASHPPGIVAETTVAELLGGERRLATRAPAWLGSIAAVVLTAWLLRDLGLSPGAVAAAVTVVFSSAMFLVYGTMLDTPVTSLPFAVAVVLVGQRVVDGRPPRPAVLVLVALAAALSGWLALGFALTQAGRLAWRSWRERTDRRPAGALVGGTALGLAVTIAWCGSVYESLGPLLDKANDKTTAVTLAKSLTRQVADAQDLLPMAALVGGLGAVAALSDRRWRGAFASTLLPVLAYAIVFRGGAHMHDYWNYALLVPLGVGAGAGAETVLRRLPNPAAMSSQVPVAAAGVVLAAVCALGLSDGEAVLRNSLGTPGLLDRAAEVAPPDGPAIAYLSAPAIESPWIPYEARRPGLALHTPAELSGLAERSPRFPVLVVWAVASEATADQLVKEAYGVSGPYAVVPSRTAAAAFPAA